MKTTSFRARALACVLSTTALCGLTASPAAAQTAREHRALDANGVDLTHGDFVLSFVEGSIGSGDAELALVRSKIGSGIGSWHVSSGGHVWDGLYLIRAVGVGGTIVSVNKDSRFERFTSLGTLPSGSSLALVGAEYHYRTTDGALIVFGDPSGSDASTSTYCNGSSGQGNCTQLPLSITSPDGKSVSIGWEIFQSCTDEVVDVDNPPDCSYWARIGSVSNSFGYRIAFTYATDGNSSSNGVPPPDSWQRRTSAALYNDVVSTTSSQASVSYSYPSTGVVEVTDMGGRVWRFTGSTLGVTAVRRPGASADTTSVTIGTSGSVTAVAKDGVTTNYSRSVSGSTATMVVTNALSQASTIVSDLTIGRPTSITDALGRTTAYQYDTSARLKRVTAPEGNYVEHTYDSRGNVTQTQLVPKSGSGLATITTSANYDASCANPATCNQPNSTTDARGSVTDYTYDATHGGVLTVTAPAPTSGATRPQTRYSYTLTNGEYQLTGVSACQTGSAPSCVGTADEVKTTVAYDSNGNVTSTSSGNGSGTLTATSAMTYDAKGDLLTVDGPLSGTADTARLRYNAAREPIGSVSPDPDGSGSLKHRATRNVIDATTGLLTRTESGTVNSQSDTDWAAFSTMEAVEVGYDANARPVTSKLVSGSTTYALTQTSYDALGRANCTARRMNPAEFGSLPSDACTLDTTGNFGPDRIVKTTFDNAGQAILVQTGYGVSGVQAAEVATTYSNNGQVATVTDAEGNTTTYEYDGHDRLVKTRMPSPTTDGVSSTTDYEELTLDANGNATARRLRDGQSIGFTFDALDRPTFKNLPASEPDVTYTYDLLGRMTGASQTGHALSFTFDALGRNLTQTHPHGTVTSTWDVAGRRTRITYPDGFYVDQDYAVTGEMIKIRENGATSGVGVLATFAYDDLGRRTSLTRGNGTSTSYSYDAVSRLSQLTQDVGGTASDLTLGFSYNPASQMVSNTRSNDAYAWAGHGSGTTSSSVNGLNQLTAVGGASVTHDARGNRTADSTRTYTYSSENLLTGATFPYAYGHTSIAYSYDPLMRLIQTSASSASRQAYDGLNLLTEYSIATDQQFRRYVHGPGVDEPLVFYFLNPNTGVFSRHWYHADERGTIVQLSDGSGAAWQTNRYDEYGKPAATNWGRFGYTGQAWLGEIGAWYYKNRVYSADTGRFLQTDPIGYGDGMNLYGYVKGDPANARDPLGLKVKRDSEPMCTGSRIPGACGAGGIAGSASGFSTAGIGGQYPTGEASLNALGINTSGKSAAEIRAIAFQALQFGEWALANGIPRSAVYTWGFGENLTLSFVPSSQGSGGVGTAKNWINTSPQFFDHVEARHFGFDDRFVSKFAAKFQNVGSLVNLASFAANHGALRPGAFPETFTYTARYSGVVGFLRGSGDPTNFVTLVVQRLGTYYRGLPEYQAITMYPGF